MYSRKIFLQGDSDLVDKNLILRKLADLDTYVRQVGEYSSISTDDYKNNWKTQRIVERTLQMAIELCADIANHIISDRGYRVPTTYADAFSILNENHILDVPLFQSLTNMCKFRNILVHEYDKVDPAIVVSILKNHLQDFALYKTIILDELSQS